MKFIFSLILVFFSVSLPAQQGVVPQFGKSDSVKTVAKDSLSTADTAKTGRKFDVDAVVYSNAADSLIFEVQKKKMYLYGSGEVKYKTTELKSGISDRTPS